MKENKKEEEHLVFMTGMNLAMAYIWFIMEGVINKYLN